MKIIKDFLKKEKYVKVKLIIAVVLSIVASVLYAILKKNFIIDRVVILSILCMFGSIHFIFKLERIYNFIYKFRYYIAGIILVLATIFEYSGSSIGVYTDVMQGESREKNFLPILGQYRSIRSDEWVVNTPIFVSQCIDKENPYNYYNDNLRGTKTDMFSVVAPGVRDILTIARPFNIGFLLFGAAKGLSIIWFGKWLALALVTFEFFMLITNKKKFISLCGAVMIVYSAALQWWNITDVITWGLLALLLIDKYLKEKKICKKILYASGIFLSAVSFVFVMYPAWQIPYIYIYIALFIYLCIKNRKEYKLTKIDIPIISLVVLAIGYIGFRYLHMSSEALNATLNTDYPGERFEIGGGGLKVLFSYVYSYLFPYIKIDNPCELSGMISFYPIPMILAVLYLIRNKDRKKHMAFFIPLLIVATMFSVFSIFKTNTLFAKITFLYMTTGIRLAVPLSFIQILLIIYLLSIMDNNKKIMKDSIAKILAIISSICIFSIAIRTAPVNLLGSLKSYCCGLILVIFIYWLLTINNEKNKRKLLYGLILMSLMTGVTVNPLQKGIEVLREKPIAKEVQKIVEQDKENNLWIADNTPFFIPNYFLASGAKVLNSTNIYPNFDLYKTVLGEENYNNEEIRKIFNRYAHLTMEINSTDNKVELIYLDSIRLYLTPDKVKDLGIKYIITLRNIEEFETQDVDFEKIYEEQGMFIYKVNY